MAVTSSQRSPAAARLEPAKICVDIFCIAQRARIPERLTDTACRIDADMAEVAVLSMKNLNVWAALKNVLSLRVLTNFEVLIEVACE